MEISNKLKKLLSSKKRARYLSREEGGESNKLDQFLATSCQQFFSQKVEFHSVGSSDSHLDYLRERYKPLNKVIPNNTEEAVMDDGEGTSHSGGSPAHTDEIPQPKREIFDSQNLVLEWKSSHGIGAGLCNLGNTCFLNSVLQCLLYTPPLYNYLTSADHKKKCMASGYCVMCSFQKHCSQMLNCNHGAVKPITIVQNLKAIAKPFRQGRQEDAHEFLRYFVDGLQKSCLQGLPPNLDPHSKATTAIHKIFGGYHRSQVKCLQCKKTSNTFDPLLDMNLDIKNCPSLLKALQRSIQSDTLEGDNCYACPYCKKMTRAQKRFTIHRLPTVLTIQLKRFEYNGLFGGKINKQVSYPEFINMRPYMSAPKGPSEWYRLYAVLLHLGYSSHSGHYYCYIKNSNNIWYCMNDAQVSQVSLTTVLSQEAYLLFYIKDEKHKPLPAPPGARKTPNVVSTPHRKPPNVGVTPGTSHRKVPATPSSGTLCKSPSVTSPLGPQHSPPNVTSPPNHKGPPKVTSPPGQQPSNMATPPNPATPSSTHATPKTPTGHLSPRSPAAQSIGSSKIKADPSFLGTAVKRTTPLVDKTGTPLVKLNPPKPTGIVNPSPHSSSSSSSLLPKHTSPKTAVPDTPTLVSPVPATPPKQQDPRKPNMGVIEGVREFSIPLRKTPLVASVSEKPLPEEEEEAPPPKPPSPVPATQPEKKAPISTPIFKPRQISAPVKLKKPPKAKRLGETAPRKVILEENTKTILTVKSIATQGQDHAPNSPIATTPGPTPITTPTPVAMGGSLLDLAEESSKSKPTSQPGFKAVSEQPPSLPPSAQTSFPHAAQTTPIDSTGSVQVFEPPSPAPQRLGSLRMAPFSLKQKVARVSPLPPTGASTKPIARVKPNMHISPLSTREEPRGKGEVQTPSTPHSLGGNQWTVTARREHAAEDDGAKSHAHGSRVREDERTHSPSVRDREHTHSKRRHKKKHRKAHHRHSDYDHERRRDKWRDDGRRRGKHTHRSESPSAASSSDSDVSYGRERDHWDRGQRTHSKKRHSNHHRHYHHKHGPSHSSSEHWTSEERRKRHRSVSSRRHDDRSESPEEHKHKRSKTDAASAHSSSSIGSGGGGSGRREDIKHAPPVTEVQWDSGGSGVRGGSGTLGWDGMKCSDTVEQLTKHSLGYQVRSWSGGENSIEVGGGSVGVKRAEVRDTWDQDLDRGKVKMVKKKVKNDFSNDTNLFQKQQSSRNKLS